MVLKYSLIFICITIWTVSIGQKKGPTEVVITLEKKESIEDYGQLTIFIKSGQRTDTLNSKQEFKKTDIVKFRRATIQLNVNYGDRKAGFNRIINRKGKIRYALYFNADNTVKYIDLYALRDKSKYEEILHLNLRVQKKTEQMIHLKDWKANKDVNIIFSSGKLFDLADIFQESVDYTFNDIMFKIDKEKLKAIWFAKEGEKDLFAKRKNYVREIFKQENGISYLTFGQLQFYIENSDTFALKPKYEIHLIDNKNNIVEF